MYNVDKEFILKCYKNISDPSERASMEDKFPDIFPCYRVGDRFVKNYLKEYLLALCGEAKDGHEVVMIDLHTGKFLLPSVKVADISHISQLDFFRLTGDNWDRQDFVKQPKSH